MTIPRLARQGPWELICIAAFVSAVMHALTILLIPPMTLAHRSTSDTLCFRFALVSSEYRSKEQRAQPPAMCDYANTTRPSFDPAPIRDIMIAPSQKPRNFIPTFRHITHYKFARTAAPPKRAPTATAAVCMGAPFVPDEEAEAALCEAELRRELTELVRELRALERDSRSVPVAVESLDSSDEATLLAPLVMEFTPELTSERIDEAIWVACDWMELMLMGLVRVAVWA